MFLLLISCTQKEDNGCIPGTTDMAFGDNVCKIDLTHTNDYPVGVFSDLFSDVHYVPLEQTDSSMISNVDKIMVTNNDDLLILDYNTKSVILFDSIGNYKNHIGLFGHAKSEFLEPLDIVYDEFHDNVIIYDNAKQSLMYYDMGGMFIKEIGLNFFIESFEVIDSSHLVVYCGFDGLENKEINYNYKVIDTQGNTIKEFAPFDKTMENVRMYRFPFHKKNGHLFSHIETTPFISEITLDEMKLKFFIDFGKYQIPNDCYTQGQNIYKQKVLEMEPYKAYSKRMFQSDKYILMSFKQREGTTNVYEKLMITSSTNLSQPHYYYNMVNDLYGKQSTLDLRLVAKNKAYFLYDPIDIRTFAEFPNNIDVSTELAKQYREVASYMENEHKLPYNNIAKILEQSNTSIVITDKEKELLKRLSQSNNPIVQICTFK